MNQTDYAYGVSYIRSIENRLMDKGDIEGLILTKTPEEAMRMLNDKGYSNEPHPSSEFEQLLSKQQSLCWETVREVAPNGAPLDILLYKNDFHNLKVVIKAVFSANENFENLFLTPATVDTAIIVEAISEKAFSKLPEMLRSVAERSYEALSNTEDSQLSDIIIDKASMDYTMKCALESKSDFLIELIRLENTLADIKIAYRAMKTEKNADFLNQALSENSGLSRETLISVALAGEDALLSFISQNGFEDAANTLKISVSEFEKYQDSTKNAFVQRANFVTLGPEPLIAYILKKQAELLSVRIIMSGKINGFPESVIRERLRD